MLPFLLEMSLRQGGFFDRSALKMTKCQPLKEFSELVLPKKRLGMKKIKVPELILPQKRLRKEKVSVPQLLR